jgi:predicted RNA methylase
MVKAHIEDISKKEYFILDFAIMGGTPIVHAIVKHPIRSEARFGLVQLTLSQLMTNGPEVVQHSIYIDAKIEEVMFFSQFN